MLALRRSLPVHGWTLAVFVWTALFGIVLRAWCVVDAAGDVGAAGWALAAIGVDLSFAALLWLLCGLAVWPTEHGRWRLVGRIASGALLVGVAVFGAANALSFRVSGTALTWHRLRGDDGATARDMKLIAWTEAWPALVLLGGGLVSLALLLSCAHRLERIPEGLRRRVLAATLVTSALCLGAYELFLAGKDHGAGRHVVAVLADSWWEDYTRRRPEIVKAFVAPPATPAGFARILTPDQPSPTSRAPVLATTSPVKNVIVFFSEGVARKHTSLDDKGPATTPRLKARASREGLELTRFYSPYHRSIQAIFSLLCGEFPTPNGMSISDLNPRIDCGEMSQVLAKNGVHAGLFHGGYFSYFDKTAFVADRGFERMVDAPTMQRQGPYRDDGQPWEEDGWGIDDRATVRALLQWIDEVRAKSADARFAAVTIPITAHYPFAVPSDIERPFGDGRKLDRFWNAVHFLDIAFDELMAGLEQRGLLDDTLVIFLADHGESPLEPPRETNVDRAMYEHDVHVPMVLFHRGLFPTRQVSDRLASIPDLLPTILDVMDIPDPHQRQGTSFLAEDWHEKRVFLGTMRSNVRQVGFVDGTKKFMFDLGTGKTELYDLVADPDEMENLSSTDPANIQRDIITALTWSKWQFARIRDAPTIDKDIDVQTGIARAADVVVRPAAGPPVACVPEDKGLPGARHCDGLPSDLLTGVAAAKVARRERFCLPVRLPEAGASAELAVAGIDWWHYVTSLRFSWPTGATMVPTTVTLAVDDEAPRSLSTTRAVKDRRFLFAAPTRSLKVTVTANAAMSSPLCLFFDEASWRPRASVLRTWWAQHPELAAVVDDGGDAAEANPDDERDEGKDKDAPPAPP